MAITTLAQVISGLQPPVFFTKAYPLIAGSVTHLIMSSWVSPGNPVAGTAGSTLNGVALTSPVTGALPWSNPGTGNAYLARLQAGAPSVASSTIVAGGLILADRLWHNGGIDVTGALSPQTVTFPGLPARDVNGNTNGVGVLLGYEISTALTPNSGATLSVSYTNSSGVSLQTANTIISSVVSGAYPQGEFFPLTLAAGDVGVQSVQSVSISGSSWIAGAIGLVAYRPIAYLDFSSAGKSSALDAITGALPLLFPGSVLFFLTPYPPALSVPVTYSGEVQFTWG